MPPKAAADPDPARDDDEELNTLTGEDLEGDDEEEEEEEGETSRDGDTSPRDPRLSLATTASMSTWMSETGSTDSDDTSRKTRRQRRMVSGLGSWLLPRSSRTAFAVTFFTALLIACGATSSSLALMDRYFNDIADGYLLTLLDMQTHDAEASIAAIEHGLASAALTMGDESMIAMQKRAVATSAQAVRTALMGAGVAPGTVETLDASSTSFAELWTRVRATPGVPAPPVLAPDLLECLDVSSARATAAIANLRSRRDTSASQFVSSTLGDVPIATLAAVAAIDPAASVVTDNDLANAAASVGAPALTQAAIATALQQVELNVALAVGTLASTVDTLATAMPAFEALMPSTTAAQKLSAAGTYSYPLSVVQRAAATATWIQIANASLAPLMPAAAPIAAAGTAAATRFSPRIATLAFAITNASSLLQQLARLTDGTTASSGVSPTLTEWYSRTTSRGNAYQFNDSALGPLTSQGVADARFTGLPWLSAQVAANYTLASQWFPPAPSAQPGAGCALTVSAVDGQVNETARWMKSALDTYAATVFRDTESGNVAKNARTGLIVTLVVCMVFVVATAIYGQAGVASRLSSSALPYGSFVKVWWLLVLFIASSVAWSTGLGLAEADYSAERFRPGAAYDSEPATAGVKESTIFTAHVISTIAQAMSLKGLQAYDIFREVRDTQSERKRPAFVLRFLAEVALPFYGNLTGGADPYRPITNLWSTDAEDDLLMESIARVLLSTGAPSASGGFWIPPSIATSSDAQASQKTLSRTTSACAVTLAARSAGLLFVDSLQLDAPALVGGALPLTVPLSTAAAVQRANAIGRQWKALVDNAVALSGSHVLRCLSASNGAAAQDFGAAFASMGAVDTIMTRVDRRVSTLAAAAIAADGSVAWRDVANLLPIRRLLLETFSTADFTVGAVLGQFNTNLTAAVSAAAASTRSRGVPLKRRIVWGHIGVCLVAQLIAFALWRLLFGVSAGVY